MKHFGDSPDKLEKPTSEDKLYEQLAEVLFHNNPVTEGLTPSRTLRLHHMVDDYDEFIEYLNSVEN